MAKRYAADGRAAVMAVDRDRPTAVRSRSIVSKARPVSSLEIDGSCAHLFPTSLSSEAYE